MNENLVTAFSEESGELLDQLEGYLLDLENNPDNRDLLDAVFRVIHTIKGSAGMVGFENINRFTHKIEDVFDQVRKGEVSFNQEIANITLRARDLVQLLITNSDMVDDEISGSMENVISCLLQECSYSDSSESDYEDVFSQEIEDEDNMEEPDSGEKKQIKTFRITFIPGEDIFLRGVNPINLLNDLNEIGVMTVFSGLGKEVPPIRNLVPEKSYLGWEILLSTEKSIEEVRDVFIFVESDSIVKVDVLKESMTPDGEVSRLGEILTIRGVISEEELSEALKAQRLIGEVLVDREKVSSHDLHDALKEQEHMKNLQTNKTRNVGESIRVSTERLDKFVDLVGELVTIQAQLDQSASRVQDMELDNISESLQRLMEDLRDTALGIRMIPVGTTFGNFRRLVRDLSRDLGKKVELVIEGGDTELDKTVIDRLNDPLMHVIRNSIDHGMESPDERSKAGKSPVGYVKLSALHTGGHVVIAVEDDGNGLDKEKIKEKAVSRGLVTAESELKDEEIFKLIFMSGFSTAQNVSNVSGRGVGMDVVKKEIESLGGHIQVKSVPGEYTRISFTLPLTLAIIDGLLVKIADDYYVLPLASVESCLEMDDSLKDNDGKKGNFIHYREHFLPFVKMRDFLKYSDPVPKREQIVVLNTEDGPFAIIVDQVIGDHQTVIKNMGKIFSNARSFSGATIMGNGRVALILNIAMIMKMSRELQGCEN